MLVFAHIGITTGAAKACDIVLSMAKRDTSQESDSRSEIAAVIGRQRLRFYTLLSRLKRRIEPIDYRLVLVGSMLPDIIDKPLFLLIRGNASLGGRDYAHTLLFNLVLLIGGIIILRSGKSWLVISSLSSFMHLILDQMWNNPVVLLWPMFGPLTRGETAGWLSNILHSLFSSPEVYIPEIIGLVIILFLTYRLVKEKSITGFLTDGAIG